MKIHKKILDFLKCIALVVGGLIGPFVLIVGPIRLAEISPEYKWIRYAPIAIFVIFCIILMASSKEQAGNESKE